MKRCKNCKHWGDTTPLWIPDYHGACLRITPRSGDPALIDNQGFASEDAVLYTAPDFGCVLFENKETE